MELRFNQIETQFDLHQITDNDKRYRLTCAALSGEVASDVRDVLLQPFLTHKYENLKAILIKRRDLTTPERVNKVITGENWDPTYRLDFSDGYRRQLVLEPKQW